MQGGVIGTATLRSAVHCAQDYSAAALTLNNFWHGREETHCQVQAIVYYCEL